ncbi:MAG: hypothetical protein QME32_08545 [Endomicrobiia bacterium]|nr:hypothetical protein [Endomicrobiia bacterium]
MAKKTVRKKVVAKEAKVTSSKSVKKAPKPSARAVKTAKAVAKSAAARPKIAIDHPSDGDNIGSHHYTVRISCSSSGLAEISINGEPWLACREAVGYRWFDWCLAGPGAHILRARLIDDNGSVLCESAEVVCEAK